MTNDNDATIAPVQISWVKSVIAPHGWHGLNSLNWRGGIAVVLDRHKAIEGEWILKFIDKEDNLIDSDIVIGTLEEAKERASEVMGCFRI